MKLITTIAILVATTASAFEPKTNGSFTAIMKTWTSYMLITPEQKAQLRREVEYLFGEDHPCMKLDEVEYTIDEAFALIDEHNAMIRGNGGVLNKEVKVLTITKPYTMYVVDRSDDSERKERQTAVSRYKRALAIGNWYPNEKDAISAARSKHDDPTLSDDELLEKYGYYGGALVHWIAPLVTNDEPGLVEKLQATVIPFVKENLMVLCSLMALISLTAMYKVSLKENKQ